MSDSDAVRRFVHETGWFADVPTKGTEWLDETTSQLLMERHDTPTTLYTRCIGMEGIVLTSTDAYSIVSCDGLLVLAHVSLPVRSRVRVTIH